LQTGEPRISQQQQDANYLKHKFGVLPPLIGFLFGCGGLAGDGGGLGVVIAGGSCGSEPPL
jgi:hypothetical protein